MAHLNPRAGALAAMLGLALVAAPATAAASPRHTDFMTVLDALVRSEPLSRASVERLTGARLKRIPGTPAFLYYRADDVRLGDVTIDEMDFDTPVVKSSADPGSDPDSGTEPRVRQRRGRPRALPPPLADTEQDRRRGRRHRGVPGLRLGPHELRFRRPDLSEERDAYR